MNNVPPRSKLTRARESRSNVAAALVALGIGLFSAADVAGDPAPAVPLEQQVGALIVTGFSGTTAPAWLRRRLVRRELGGVVLFGRNVVSQRQVRALDASIQRAAHGDALIALDQEGGQVRRLPWASPLRDGSRQATVHIAYRSAQAAAHDLRAAGANVNLAPVADVALGQSSEMRRRAFPGGAAPVARLVAAAVRGYRSTGVLATAKHFPGFGAARANTDDAVIRIDRTRTQLEQAELAPFRAAIAQHVPIVMVSHALYPALDPNHIASQSPAIIGALLRGELRFKGLVVTDSLEARAVLARSSVAVAAERSLRAGADVLLLSGGDYGVVFRHVVAAARADAGLRRRIADAYARVMATKVGVRTELS
jgi:beta-N-acetylhexosaminidase